MNFALQRDWKEAFALAADAKAAKRREEQTKLFYDELDQQEEKKHKAKEKDEREAKELLEAATAEQVAAFNQHLDSYDTQTVHALMENGEALDKLGVQLRRMEDDAYLLPDGRRVFKTHDGQRVFDQHGADISRDVIDPREIGDKYSRWETYKAANDAKAGLELERQGLLDYQAKLDDARSRAGHGDMSKKQLDDLDADLKASMPAPVRQKLGLASETGDDLRMRAEGKALANPPSITDETARRLQAAPFPR